MKLTDWTVDYGQGPIQVQIPHAWRQDVPVSWEGPAVYRCRARSSGDSWLLFHGVSFEARVIVNGSEVGTHRGIWDAFAFAVPDGDLEIEVHVVKNGGPTFPVRDVASGFLPFVFHTFGGIFKNVELVTAGSDPSIPSQPASTSFVQAEGTKLTAPGLATKKSPAELAAEWVRARKEGGTQASPDPQGGPFYARGVLTWGWYPELGHCNPPDETIAKEIEHAKRLGFNLVKFCLWVPSHRHLELLHEAGMWAWIELPLWDPTPDSDRQQEMVDEMERIARQYAHHPNIAFWTCGCELHESTSAMFRKGLYDRVRDAFPGEVKPLVKDNSGSAEMYGGDLREFGDFYDFHPYCDTPFYPEVLDSLLLGPRIRMPILLGEFNDIDVHRDLPRLWAEQPYWLSENPDLNHQGVRWQHDLPKFLPANRFARDPEEHRHEALMASSRNKARFIRKVVQEAVRARSDIAGYVVTGWRDTPISTAGIVDDWGEPRYGTDELAPWNGPTCLFQISTRRPPWVRGGNRPGWIDPFNWSVGRAFWKIGIHSEKRLEGHLEWDVLHFTWEGSRRPQGRVAHGTAEEMVVEPLEAVQVGEISWDAEHPGGYLLRVRFAGVENSWPVWVLPAFDPDALGAWHLDDPYGLFDDVTGFKSRVSNLIDDDELGDLEVDSMLDSVSIVSTRLGIDTISAQKAVVFLTAEDTIPMPFWRESAYEFSNTAFWDHLGFREQWERLLPLTPDCALDMESLRIAFPGMEWEVLLNRIDVRTYAEHPILARGELVGQRVLVTTLRPFGGLGNCPRGIKRNPSGYEFLVRLLEAMRS